MTVIVTEIIPVITVRCFYIGDVEKQQVAWKEYFAGNR